MAILTVTYSDQHQTDTYTLHRELLFGVERYNNLDFSFVHDHFLHRGHSEVMKGPLTSSSAYDGPMEVVCKWVTSDEGVERLKKEAELYVTRLVQLQGHCVPRFIGYFSGFHQDDQDVIPIACILLEYCGQRVQGYIGDGAMELRVKAYRALEKLHGVGLAHGDVEEDDRHFLVHGDCIYLIDFDHSYKHECARKQDVYPYDSVPQREKFDCSELHLFARYRDIWTPVYWRFLGYQISLREIYNVDLAFKKAQKLRPKIPDVHLRKAVERLFDEFCEDYGDRWPIVFAEFGDPASAASTIAAKWPMNPDEDSVQLRRRLAWLQTWPQHRK